MNRFLVQLTEQGCVTTYGTTSGTTVTLVNYDKFQGERTTDDTTNGTTDGTTKRTTKRTHNKNGNTSNGYTMNDSTSVDPASLWDPQGRVYE